MVVTAVVVVTLVVVDTAARLVVVVRPAPCLPPPGGADRLAFRIGCARNRASTATNTIEAMLFLVRLTGQIYRLEGGRRNVVHPEAHGLRLVPKTSHDPVAP